VATQVVIVRALSKSDFGLFAYGLALVAGGRVLLSLGQGKLLSRFMSTYDERGDHARMLGSMVLTIFTIAVTSVLLICGLAAFGDIFLTGAVDRPGALTILVVVALMAPLDSLDLVFESLFAVFSRPRAIFVRKYLLTPGLRLVVVVLLALLDQGVLVLAVGYLATQLFGLLLYATLLVGLLRRRGLLGPERPRRLVLPVRESLAFSLPTMTTELVYLSMQVVSVLLLGAWRGTAAVATYRAVFPAARLNQFVFATFVTLYLPMAARLRERQDHKGVRTAYWQTAAVLAVLTFPVFAMSGPFATVTTVTLFGQRYENSAPVLALLAVGYFTSVVLGFNAFTLQVYGRLRFLVMVNVACAALNISLSVLLIPRAGAVGVAAANCATMVVQNVVIQWRLAKLLDTGFLDRRALRLYLVLISLVTTLALVGWLLDPPFLVAVTLSGLSWLILLLTTRSTLRLAEAFPEARRLPLVRHLVQ